MTPDLFGQIDPAGDPVRIAWRKLVEERLPRAAQGQNWPIHLDHCFARVLLDTAVGQPWREKIPAPAWKNTPKEILEIAIALGEGVLDGTQNLSALNAQSLALRGKSARQ